MEFVFPAGQERLAAHAESLEPARRSTFLAQAASVDWARVRNMHLTAGPDAVPAVPEGLRPATAIASPDFERPALRSLGLQALAQGRCGFLLMAGGQGSRLGYDGPKGACPLGLPGGRTLFAVVLERLAALGRACGQVPPLAVMTSPENDAATRAWFDAHRIEGAPDPSFFRQSVAPALSASGEALLGAPGLLALVPDGNGGIWESFADAGLLEAWKAAGIEWIHVAGVDNLLSRPCDPVLLGLVLREGAASASKTVLRRDADERVGVFALDPSGRTRIAEYTELPPERARACAEDGLPLFREANIASHLVRLDLFERFASLELPWHLARKAVRHIDPRDGSDRTNDESACKYERFLFDAFPEGGTMLLQRVAREQEFAPVKNASGQDSPESARALLGVLHTRWREAWGEEGRDDDPFASFDGERPVRTGPKS